MTRSLIAVVCCLACCLEIHAEDKLPAAEESWQVIYIGEQRVGYQHGRQLIETRDKKPVVVSHSESHFRIKRFGQELNISTSLRTEETMAGDLLKFAFELNNPPTQATRSEGEIKERELELTSTVAGRTSTRRVPWENDAKSPAYPERLLREEPMKRGDTRSTKIYMPEFGKFSKLTHATDELRPVKLLDGKEQSLLLIKVQYSAIPENNSRQYVNARGETLLVENDMLGLTARAFDVSRDVALQAIAGAELDLALNTLVRIDPPLRDAHRKKKISYRITGDTESPEKSFVAGGTQTVKRLTDKSIEVSVLSQPIPPVNSRSKATEPQFLAATRFLQVNDPAVRQHADRAAGGETDPSRIATRLEKYVHEKLTKKNFSTAMASAAEVAERMEGDCTEHAVLLAALLRAKKVPSRVAAGLVYVESLNAFGGHMWTEAYLAGEWIPLDATLGRGGIGAAHLKMAESALEEDAPLPVTTFLPLYHALGKLKIEVIKAD